MISSVAYVEGDQVPFDRLLPLCDKPPVQADDPLAAVTLNSRDLLKEITAGILKYLADVTRAAVRNVPRSVLYLQDYYRIDSKN